MQDQHSGHMTLYLEHRGGGEINLLVSGSPNFSTNLQFRPQWPFQFETPNSNRVCGEISKISLSCFLVL